ncbi:hypothetical protein [Haloarchaeobius salinus]|uniref:hypothetical protein n=1 Tax=Haloarchaeobius salinus TaxID=1198298 RepID=UPI002109E384|nr:hypothetical protein [Haloarchaeobius salinus]
MYDVNNKEIGDRTTSANHKSICVDELNNAIYVSKYGSDSQAIADVVADAPASGTVVIDKPDGGTITVDAQKTFTKRVTILWLSDAAVADSTITAAGQEVLRFEGDGTQLIQLAGKSTATERTTVADSSSAGATVESFEDSKSVTRQELAWT